MLIKLAEKGGTENVIKILRILEKIEKSYEKKRKK